MKTTNEKLYIDVSVRNAAKAVSDLKRIARAANDVRRASGAGVAGAAAGGAGAAVRPPLPGAPVPRPSSVPRGAAGGAAGGVGAGGRRVLGAAGGVGRTVAGVLGVAGAAAMVGLAKEASLVATSVRDLGVRLGLSGEALDGLTARVRELSDATGQTQQIMAGAIRTATDYGASLKQASDAMDELETLSRLWATDLGQTSGAFGVVSGANPTLNGEQAAGVLKAMVEGMKIPEAAALDLITRLMPTMQGLGGTGQEQAGLLTGLVRAGGENLVGDPERLKELVKGLTKAFADPQTKKSLAKLGIEGESAADVIASLGQAVAEGTVNFDELPASLRPLAEAMASSATFMSDFTDGLYVSSASISDLAEAMRKTAEAAPPDDFAVQWQKLKNQLIELGLAILPVISALAEFTNWLIAGSQSSQDAAQEEAVTAVRSAAGKSAEAQRFQLAQALAGKSGAERERLLAEAKAAGMSSAVIGGALGEAGLGTMTVLDTSRLDAGEADVADVREEGILGNLPLAFREGFAGLTAELRRASNLTVNVNVTGDGVRVDARNDNESATVPTVNTNTTPGRP